MTLLMRLLEDPVFLLVIALQLAILGRCGVLARGDESEELDRLRKTFKQDILGRARRGDGPDWVRYMDEADRVHERRVDRMRVWATAALVAGIGGTMLALAVRLGGLGLAAFDLEEVLTAFAPALWASLTGVLNNLLITLGLFRLSDRRFERALNDFRQTLLTCSDENAPRERFTDAVRDQLGEAFREAVRSFPEAFAQLDNSVQHMDSSVQHMSAAAAAQSQSMVEAADGLQHGVDGLTAAAERIKPVAELLNTSTTELRAVPDDLRQTLDETRAAWAKEMDRDQKAFLGSIEQVLGKLQQWERERGDAAVKQQAAWRETVDLVQKAAKEIVDTAEALPAKFTRYVEQIAVTLGEKLGRQFGIEAQNHIVDLRQEMQKGNQTLCKQIEASMRELQNRLLDDTSRVVGKSAEEVHRRVGEPLTTMLQRVTRGIEEALRQLPENAETFAASLGDADEKLQQSIARLQESADHLKGVVELTENFQASLAAAFRDGAAESFAPFRKDLQDIASELRRAAGSGRQRRPGFFRRLLDRLRRRQESADGPPDGRQLGLQ